VNRLAKIPFLPVLIGLFSVVFVTATAATFQMGNTLEALGPPPIPEDNLQSVDENGMPLLDDPKVELGKMLFFENRLSGDASISCADCHSDDFGFSDGQDLCRAYQAAGNWRNCPTVVNAAYKDDLFWDGRAPRLEDQAKGAATSVVEGHGDTGMMEERLALIPNYVDRFKTVFGTDLPQEEDIWKAIAAFERTIVQIDTPFDQFMIGNLGAMTDDAKAGMALFMGKAACIQCHMGPLLSDQQFHNIGVPDNELFATDPLTQVTFRFQQIMNEVPEDIREKVKTDLGLYLQTKDPEDMGKFRTPSLRYLTYSAPYMHNGAFFTLEEVVDFYNDGAGEDQFEALGGVRTRSDLVRPLNLSDDEKRQLVAFLESTSGKEIKVDQPVLPPYADLN